MLQQVLQAQKKHYEKQERNRKRRLSNFNSKSEYGEQGSIVLLHKTD
jgi:hypothetical protein